MFSNRMVLGGLCVAGVVAAIGTAARADSINTSGVACKNYNAGEALDIDYQTWGVQNINASPRSVVCPVPRSPLTGAAPFPEFWVDGMNVAGTTTSCCAMLFDFDGTFLSSVCWSEGAASLWSQPVTFSIKPSTFHYVNLLCTLPGNRGGTILGATAVGQ